MQKKKVIHIAFKFSHHNNHSGYDLLSDYLKVDKVFTRDTFDFTFKWLYKIKGLGRINLLIEKVVFKFFNKKLHTYMNRNPGIYHFLHPENTLAYFDYPIPPEVTIVSTFHQPKEAFLSRFNREPKKIGRLNNLRRTNIAISLCKLQMPILEKEIEPDMCYFIPHGVDTDFFIPSIIPRIKTKILVVGNWLRDFKCVAEVSNIIFERSPDITFIIISGSYNKNYFKHSKNVEFYSNISDDTLLKHYQSAQILFLPLKGAIANNALLEASACGLPIACTFHEEIRDYFDENELIFFDIQNHSSPQMLSNLILETLSDKQLLGNRSLALRKKALQLDWKKIARQMTELYAAIGRNRPEN